MIKYTICRVTASKLIPYLHMSASPHQATLLFLSHPCRHIKHDLWLYSRTRTDTEHSDTKEGVVTTTANEIYIDDPPH